MRSQQPFSRTSFDPFPLIDHPQKAREIALRHAGYFTMREPTAFLPISPQAIDTYSKRMERLLKPPGRQRPKTKTKQPDEE